LEHLVSLKLNVPTGGLERINLGWSFALSSVPMDLAVFGAKLFGWMELCGLWSEALWMELCSELRSIHPKFKTPYIEIKKFFI